MTDIKKRCKQLCVDFGYKLVDNVLIFQDGDNIQYKSKIIVNGVNNRHIIKIEILEGEGWFKPGDMLNFGTFLHWNRKIEKDPFLKILNQKNYQHEITVRPVRKFNL